jgi:hypothetical protein
MSEYEIKITLHLKNRGDWYYQTNSVANPAYGPDEHGICIISCDYFVSDGTVEDSWGPFATFPESKNPSPSFSLRMEESGPVLISRGITCFNDHEAAHPDEIPLGLPSKHTFILKGERFTIETQVI